MTQTLIPPCGGRLVNLPTRAVTGAGWTGREMCWRHAPREYAAIHYHEDDLYDAGWATDFEFTVPEDLPSGAYVMRLAAEGHLDELPFYVRPPRGRPSAAVLFIASTYTYQAYANHARMGRYTVAVAKARATGTTPDIVADDHPGRVKYGVALSVEQPLADGGETGLFLRLGWDDGQTETFAYTEVDTLLSGGLQVSGVHWGRGADRLGLALASGGLAAPHRRYLAAGGKGFILGDGRLTYGRETIVEGYYRVQVGRYVQLSPGVQFVDHPGFNKDRGPAVVIGLRLRVSVGGTTSPGT